MLTRRSLLRAIPALLAAPAIVRVSSLMPVKVMPRGLAVGDSITFYNPDFSAELQEYIITEVLPLAQRQLVAYQFGDPFELPEKATVAA
ncbi:MAG: hypothetical protein KGL39_41555 [Patescibacteria group bacterium]|nr:hypothetical protein [Patescibacteria group bacterium]